METSIVGGSLSSPGKRAVASTSTNSWTKSPPTHRRSPPVLEHTHCHQVGGVEGKEGTRD